MSYDPRILIGFGLGAAAVTALLVHFLIRLAPRIGLLDRPNERSLHTRVTPRGGGIGFVLTTLGGVVGWLALRPSPSLHTELGVFLLAAGFVAAVSLWDDFRSVGAGWRFLCHIAAAAVVVRWLGPMTDLAMPWGGALPLGAAGPLLTVLWIVGLTNVYNFMDGIDGIAGVQGVVAGTAWAVVGLGWSLPWTAWFGVMLAGGCAGFLLHNWSPAKIFMGDVGSAFLGFCFATLSLLALRELPAGADVAARAQLPWFALLAVWPFVGDGVFTFVQRVRRLEPVWKAHRSHLYQKLVRLGWSHAQVSRLYAGWCAASATGGILWLLRDVPWAAGATATLAGGMLAVIALLVARGKKETEVKHG